MTKAYGPDEGRSVLDKFFLEEDHIPNSMFEGRMRYNSDNYCGIRWVKLKGNRNKRRRKLEDKIRKQDKIDREKKHDRMVRHRLGLYTDSDGNVPDVKDYDFLSGKLKNKSKDEGDGADILYAAHRAEEERQMKELAEKEAAFQEELKGTIFDDDDGGGMGFSTDEDEDEDEDGDGED
uniref:Uncharacterized protein n=2 Tax=Lotharella globosa TaxID=91324 RepID=A0A7S4DEM9_9EUKA